MYGILMTTSMALGMLARRLWSALCTKQVILKVDRDYSMITPGHICVTSIEVNGLQARRADIGRLTNSY